MADLLQKGGEQLLDPVQAKNLRGTDLLELVGGMDFLIDLAGMMGTAANVIYHAGIVKEKSMLRQLITVSSTIASEAYAGADEAAAILDRAQAHIYEVSEDSRAGGFSGVSSIVPRTFKSIEEAFQSGSDVTGLHTGFADMDRKTGGLQKGDLIIVAARPSMGKTSFALNLAYNVAMREKVGVGVFSLEMAREQLVMRMLGSSGSFNLHNLRRGKLRAEDWPRLTQACDQLSQLPIHIDDTSSISVLEMKAKSRRLKQQHGLGLIVVDYLQLMTGGGRVENRQQEISHHQPPPQGHGQGPERAGDRPVPAVARRRGPRRPQTHAQRSAGIRCHRTGCGSGPVHIP